MTQQVLWSDFIATLSKLDIEHLNIPESQKEMRKEYVDLTKELFINCNETSAACHAAKLIGLLLSQK